MVADIAADIEVDKVADMVADKKNEVDVCTKTETKCIGPKLFDAKCTRFACLLSFVNLLKGVPPSIKLRCYIATFIKYKIIYYIIQFNSTYVQSFQHVYILCLRAVWQRPLHTIFTKIEIRGKRSKNNNILNF